MSGSSMLNPVKIIQDPLKSATAGPNAIEKINPLKGAVGKAVAPVVAPLQNFAPRPLKPFFDPNASNFAGGMEASIAAGKDITGVQRYQTKGELDQANSDQQEAQRVEGVRQNARSRILGSRRQFGDNLASAGDLAGTNTDLPNLTPEEAALSPELQPADQQNSILSSITGSRKADILQRRRAPGRNATILSRG